MKHWISFLSVLILIAFGIVFTAVSCDAYRQWQRDGNTGDYSTENVAKHQ